VSTTGPRSRRRAIRSSFDRTPTRLDRRRARRRPSVIVGHCARRPGGTLAMTAEAGARSTLRRTLGMDELRARWPRTTRRSLPPGESRSPGLAQLRQPQLVRCGRVVAADQRACSWRERGSGRAGGRPLLSSQRARGGYAHAGRLYRGRVDVPCVAPSPARITEPVTGHPFAQRHEVASRGSGHGGVSAGRWALTPLATRNSAATSRVAASAPSGNT
jgi:hypothetical protein